MGMGRTDFTLLHKHTGLPRRVVDFNRTNRFAISDLNHMSNLLAVLRSGEKEVA